jgi:hypothetical protein
MLLLEKQEISGRLWWPLGEFIARPLFSSYIPLKKILHFFEVLGLTQGLLYDK